MPTTVPNASDLNKINTDMLKASSDAAAKKARGGYSLQSVGNASLERELSALIKAMEDVSKKASTNPTFGRLYASQIDSLKKLLQTAKSILANKSLLGTIVLASLLKLALPMIIALKEASTQASPARSINDQVSEMMKKIFVGGDLGPLSRAVQNAVKVDMPVRGGTVDKLRLYLSSEPVKKWYRTQFGLR